MIRRIVLAIVVFIVVAIVVNLLGKLCLTITDPTVQAVGRFLSSSSGLIGFLAGLCYFFFGSRSDV